MNAQDKKNFVQDMLMSLERSILKHIDAMPAEWDGHELRQYIVDKATEKCLIQKMPTKAMQSYRNEIIVRNL